MRYVNVGAFVNGKRPMTKKALKDAVSNVNNDPPDARYVNFDCTSLFDGLNSFYCHQIPEDITLQVCGPDPYNNRKWYASVSRKGDKVVVK